MGSVSETISDRRYAPGRRSVCIVPMKSGNRAQRDPREGRRASRIETR
jgi:hypothetical protein